jgi:hypothetical protein
LVVPAHALIAFQEQPAPPQQPGPVDIHIDLSGLANLIWQSFIDHIGDVGNAVWTGIRDHMSDIGWAIWQPLEQTLHGAAVMVWSATFGALGNFLGQLPPEWTYELPAYRTIATNPVQVAAGGATLALVLLGLRTLLGSMIGRDSVITHITGRLIPAVFLTLAYPVVIVRAVQLRKEAAGPVANATPIPTLVQFPEGLTPATSIPFAVIWLLVIFYGLRLLLRMAYSLFRFLVALVFGPVAIILWSIPQTEWVTWFWLRELVGWGTTPLLVAVALSLALPLAAGRSGFLAAAAFGIAGLMAAYDLVGVLSVAHGGRGLSPVGYVRMAVGAASGGGAGVATASIPANRMTTLAEQYGYD